MNIIIILNLIFSSVILIKIYILEKDKESQLSSTQNVTESSSEKNEEEYFYKNKFDKFKENNDEWAANLVIRNAFLNDPGNRLIFENYYNYLLNNARKLNDYNKKLSYINDAGNALITFSEYADLDNFEFIKSCRQTLKNVENEIEKKQVEKIKDENLKILKDLESLVNKLRKTKNETEIRMILESAGDLENRLNLSLLNDIDYDRYNKLKDVYEDLATQKGDEINRLQHKKYNEKAVKQIHKFFEEFKENEKDYEKDKKDIINLVKNRYDIVKLNADYFNQESLTYFNHVYNYIFGKISDEKKFELTKIMTLSDKESLV